MADPVLRQIIASNIARALSWKMLRVVAHVAGDLPCSLSGPVTPSEIAAVPPQIHTRSRMAPANEINWVMASLPLAGKGAVPKHRPGGLAIARRSRGRWPRSAPKGAMELTDPHALPRRAAAALIPRAAAALIPRAAAALIR